MTDRHLHIVSFDIPFPADYGGVMDVFHKLKALSEVGVKVHLHCYEYGRSHADELNEYCVSVNYYKRDMSARHLLSRKPFIVASRVSRELIGNLSHDDYPILFEGLHTCGITGAPELKNRRIFIRAHNVEHDYYRSLAKAEKRLSKRVYLRGEANKLLRFQDVMLNADAIFAIQQADAAYFSEKYKNVIRIPAFNPFDRVEIQQGRGDYALYHGKLSVGENEVAARFLIDEVFAHVPYKLIVAGAEPSLELQKLARSHSNVELIANPDDETMFCLIGNAHVNVLYTEQATGLKLKLLNVLYRGRFCLLNDKMVEGTPLGDLCVIANTAEEYRQRLDELFEQPFDADLTRRIDILDEQFNNLKNAQRIADEIFGE